MPCLSGALGTGMAETQLVQGLIRGLLLLRQLNERNHATALELSRATGLPRGTTYRLLDSLIEAGYVSRGARRGTYRLTVQVRALADGFNDEAWISEVASPVLADLGNEIVWPTDIGTFDRDAMIIRDTTHASSPLSINREKAGFRPPVLLSALGQAYLAWSPPQDQDAILTAIASSGQPDAGLAADRAAAMRLLQTVRRKGYGFREGGISPRTGSIAVPVLRGERPIAAINLHYILSALTEAEVVAQYLAPLQRAAKRIEQRISQLSPDDAELERP